MRAAERLQHVLETPGVWFVFTMLQVSILGWLLTLALPGDPSTYPVWLQIALFVVLAVGMTAVNVKLRRRLFRRWP